MYLNQNEIKARVSIPKTCNILKSDLAATSKTYESRSKLPD